MSDDVDRMARRLLRHAESELAHAPEPITRAELDAALVYGRAIGAPPWLIRLLERHRNEATTPD